MNDVNDRQIAIAEGEVVVLCLPTQTSWSAWKDAETAAAAHGGKLNPSVPPRTIRAGVVGDVDLEANGLKAVIYVMRCQ